MSLFVNLLLNKFTAESHDRIILKIGQHSAKLSAIIHWKLFHSLVASGPDFAAPRRCDAELAVSSPAVA